MVLPTMGWDFPLSMNSRQCSTYMLTGQPSRDTETFFSADSSLCQVDKLTIHLSSLWPITPDSFGIHRWFHYILMRQGWLISSVLSCPCTGWLV